MSQIMLICLYVLGGLSVLFLTFIAVKVGKNFYKVKDAKPIKAEHVDIDEDTNETKDDVEEIEVKEEENSTVNVERTQIPADIETYSEVIEKPIDIKESDEVAVTESEEVKEVESEPLDKEPENVINIGEIEDETDELADKLNIKRVHFAQKLLKLDEHALLYYDEIYNKFNSYRGVNIRLSFKHLTFRYKRKLISKLTIKGKTLKLHLALDVNAFNKNVYFQTSLESVKAYEEVPFTVKVKSARGLKNALALITTLCEKEGIEIKSRYKKVNSIKEIMEVVGIN